MKVCSVEGCGRPHSARGRCKRHYMSAYLRAWRKTKSGKASSLRSQRRYYRKNKFGKIRATRLRWRATPKGKASVAGSTRRYYAAHRRSALSRANARHQRDRRELRSNYVRQLVVRDATGLSIPSALIEAKRAQLKLHRLTQED